MLSWSRRIFALSTAATAIGLGLDRPLAFMPQAFAQKSADPTPGYHRYRIGSVECTAFYDGIWEKPHDPAFIRNASIDDTRAAMAAGGFTPDFVSIPFTVLLVNTGGKLVLCDAGTGGQVQPTAGKLAANMRAAGIDPERIDTVLISHFHPDHIFGLMAKDTNAPIFPRAEIVVPAAEYRWWTDPGVFTRLAEARHALARRIQAVFPTWKNIRQVEGEGEVAPNIRMVAAPGHTPGHAAFHLASGSQQLLISADTAYVPALLMPHPEWHGVYDQDAPLAESTRRRLLDRVVADNMMIAGYHFPFPAIGQVAKDGRAYAFTPAKAV